MENIGKLLPDNKVEFGITENGFCYKDFTAYESGEGICYIPEYGINEDNEIELSYARLDIEKAVREWLCKIEQINDEQRFAKICKEVFYAVDWQGIETYLNDFYYE